MKTNKNFLVPLMRQLSSASFSLTLVAVITNRETMGGGYCHSLLTWLYIVIYQLSLVYTDRHRRLTQTIVFNILLLNTLIRLQLRVSRIVLSKYFR